MAFEDAIAEILAQNKKNYQKEIQNLLPDQSSQKEWLNRKRQEIFNTLSENKAFIKKCNRKNQNKRKSFIKVPLPNDKKSFKFLIKRIFQIF